MLDTDTKRRIDTARDILVGKVPDPKSQVEQITIALIYKFMDDMDAESEEFGGKRKFFANEFARYGWAKLMRSGLGGHETINLYAEAIARMPENPGIPLLFREIFKNADLPYRDPETLRAFLKIIDEFSYDHSERLGDAFEYLLSVLGSQGDAGQFRTPRHIIDFIVAIIDPKKTETALDPACGTAGFLISSYKHILKANTSPPSPGGTGGWGEGDLLTPDEKGRLAQNFKGYDISPDMVRLSLVNMYLHGFADPHIFEYDTLTSQERWNEYADIILANPPFMSPKGGIKPHNRFSVHAKRSEVLFVDYMAEHLTPSGRAGIIVPEGIIFNSQNAYKQLRKMLVEEYLVAVVSLPAGVFKPYAGVKTSILILDKSLAKKTDRIAFFKVENDGFGLGDQRRPIDKNDLPQAQAEIGEYLRRLRAGETVEPSPSGRRQGEGFQPTCGLIVPKEKIAANEEYNLSGERYREINEVALHWPIVTLKEVAIIESGSRQKGGAIQSGIPSIGGEQIDEKGNIRLNKMKYISESHFRGMKKGVLKKGDVLIVKDGATTGKTGLFTHKMPAAVNEHVFLLRAKDPILPYYLYHAVRAPVFQFKLRPFIKGIIGGVSLEFCGITIPLPPLEVQREIVAEIEGYQKVIDGARAVLDNYRPHIPIHPDWPMVELGEVCIVNPKKSEVSDLDDRTEVSFVPMSNISENAMFIYPRETKRLNEVTASYTYFKDGDVLIAKVTPCFENGKAGIARNLRNGIGFGSSELYVLRPTKAVLPEWLFMGVAIPAFRTYAIPQMTGTGGLQRVPKDVVDRFKIPVPPLATQQAIVSEIEAEQALVAANRELIERFEKNIQATLARVWGEDKPTPAEA